MRSTLGRSFYEIVREKTVDTQAVTIPQEFCAALSYICAGSSARLEEVSQYLLSECSTWRLISMLQEDIMGNAMVEDVVQPANDKAAKFRSDAEIINDLYDGSPQLRHLQVIVDWLQESAGEAAQELYHACEIRWPKPTDFWASLNDGHYGDKVKKASDLQLDFIFDECNALSPALAEDIDLLYKAVFHLLRAGELARAQDLCDKMGHAWLAVAIGGHQLFEDCPYDKLTSSVNVGNRHRLAWQSVAWSWLQERASEPDKGSTYERAVFGILCGRLDAVLPVARTWHDRIWACVTTYINIKATRRLVENSAESAECFLPSAYFDQLTDVASIFRTADEADKRRATPAPIFERVQRCLIEHGLDNFTELLAFFLQLADSLKNEISEERSAFSLDDLRFCIHILQWLKVLGIVPASDRNLVPIYVRYVSLLSSSPDNVDLAAFYTSQMPKPIDDEVFVGFIDSCLARAVFTQDDEDQFIKRTLFEARSAGLSVARVLDELMRLRLVRFKADGAAVVHGLTWYYLLEPVLSSSDAIMADLVRYSNAVVRMFLLDGKNQLARQVFGNVRPDTVTVIAAPTLRASLASPSACLVREYLCYKALFLALDRLADWNAAWAAYGQSAAQRHDKDVLELHDLERATDELVQATYNVLLFAGPGWLVDDAGTAAAAQPVAVDANRQTELDQLRRHYVPELSLSLSLCLARVGQSRRSDRVHLVDALMSPHRRNLAALFSQQQLATIARSASCVLAE